VVLHFEHTLPPQIVTTLRDDQFNAAHGDQVRGLTLRGNFDSATPTCSKRKRQALHARYAAAQEAIDNGTAYLLGGAAESRDYDGKAARTPSRGDDPAATAISIAAVLEAGLADKRYVVEIGDYLATISPAAANAC